ncbi:MAG: hypothetical protein Q9167_006381 [Letrouitia subvulpina]
MGPPDKLNQHLASLKSANEPSFSNQQSHLNSSDNSRRRTLRTQFTYRLEKKLEPFKYRKLPTPRSIRLLAVLPDDDGRIRCRMATVDLDSKRSFIALSYTWGDPLWRGPYPPSPQYQACDYEIDCDGRALLVHKNLHDALLELRRKITAVVADSKDVKQEQDVMSTLHSLRASAATANNRGLPKSWATSFIWIDAICINQQDLAERSAQVAIMGDIYRTAKIAVIWLGPHQDRADEAIRVCSILATIPMNKWREIRYIDSDEAYRELGIPRITQEQWQAFGTFAQRGWFSRAWILQEAVLARKHIVLYRHDEIDWNSLVLSFRLIIASKWESEVARLTFEAAGVQKDDTHNRQRMTANCTKVAAISRLRKRRRAERNLWSLLTTLRNCVAQNPRDLIYAALGMVEPAVTTIVPDYTKSVAEVFTEAAWAIIDETKNLQIFYFCPDPSIRKVDDLPSWVPDWSARLQPEPLRGEPHGDGDGEIASRWYPSGDHRWIRPKGPFGSRELVISAMHITTVEATATPFFETSTPYDLHAMLDLVIQNQASASRPLSPNSAYDTLWRTLIADTIGQGPADRIYGHRYMFHHWLIRSLWNICQDHPGDDALIQKTRASLAEFAALDNGWLAPDLDTVDDSFQAMQDDSSSACKNKIYNHTHFINAMLPRCSSRQLFRTKNGLLGLGCETLCVGDQVVVALGSDVPLLLRPLADRPGVFQFVGQAYVHEIMHGEALALLFESDAEFEDIVLI